MRLVKRQDLLCIQGRNKVVQIIQVWLEVGIFVDRKEQCVRYEMSNKENPFTTHV